MNRIERIAGHVALPVAAAESCLGTSLVVQPTAGNSEDWKAWLAAQLWPLLWGPAAVKKLVAMCAAMFGSSSSFQALPSGEKVEIVFQEKGAEAKKWCRWMPENQHLYEVFMNQSEIGDFALCYKDKNGKQWDAPATKEGVEQFLAQRRDDPSAALQVEWRPPTTIEKVQSRFENAKAWMTGQGGATDQAVKDAP